MEDFDYIIVGGGLTGSAVASRLTQGNSALRVGLIEAGPDASSIIETTTPLGAFGLGSTSLNWAYETEPQKHLNNRTMREINGHVLGGGSMLNYGGWCRGNAADYDLWAKTVGDRRWSYEGMMPFFRRSEHHWDTSASQDFFGFDGPMHTFSVSASDRQRRYPLREFVRNAWLQSGVKPRTNADGSNCIGLGEWVENWLDGKRQPSHKAYDLTNVHVMLETFVSKINLGETSAGVMPRAVGVTTTDGRRISARKEVIVSTGAYRSPQLLMLSGIGSLEQLKIHGIRAVAELPEVGNNLFDHLAIFQWWKLARPEQGLTLGSPAWSEPALFKGLPCDWVVCESPSYEALEEAMQTDGESHRHPLLQNKERAQTALAIIYVPALANEVGLDLPIDGSYLTTSALSLWPTSRGSVGLRSPDPECTPVINANHLATEVDRLRLRDGMRKAMRALETHDGQHLVAGETPPPDLPPLSSESSDEDLDIRLKHAAVNYKHASGTCAMGKVVDSELRAYGIHGLRVVDASVLPNPVTPYPQAFLYALAEQAAEMILSS